MPAGTRLSCQKRQWQWQWQWQRPESKVLIRALSLTFENVLWFLFRMKLVAIETICGLMVVTIWIQ